MLNRVLLCITILLLYLLLGTALAIYSRRRLAGTEQDFYVASGRLGGFLSAMTYAATTYSSFMIVGLVGLAYTTGVGALGFELVYFVGTLMLLVLFARRVWSLARQRGWVTPGEMLSELYGSRAVGATIGLVYLFAMIPYASAQLRGVGESLGGLGGSDTYFYLGVALGAFLVLSWSLLAGIWSVALTDAFQGLWMLTSAILLLVWVFLKLYSSNIGVAEVSSALEAVGFSGPGGFWSIHVFLAFTVPWIFFAVTNPQVVQRLFMPRDSKSLSTMIRLFAVFGITYTVTVTLIGLLARAGVERGTLSIVVERRDDVTPGLLGIANPVISALVFTSIVAASVSTANSILLTLAGTVARDIVSVGREKARLRVGYVVAALITVAMVAIAASGAGYIVQLSVLSSLLLLSIAPPTLAAWIGVKSHPIPIVLAVLSGPAIMLVEALKCKLNYLVAFFSAPLGIPVSTLILAVSSVLVAMGVLVRKMKERRSPAGSPKTP